MHELSIFVDESGDFGPVEPHNPFYLLTLLFHEQDNSFVLDAAKLDNHLRQSGAGVQNIHTGPLIRQEEMYRTIDLDARRALFRTISNFTRASNVTHKTFIFEKRHHDHGGDLYTRMTESLRDFFDGNIEAFLDYDRVVIYYDNGQGEIKNMLLAVCEDIFKHTFQYKEVNPFDYKLFQVADFICTVERLALKKDRGTLSRSETMFFSKKSKELRNHIRIVQGKRFSN